MLSSSSLVIHPIHPFHYLSVRTDSIKGILHYQWSRDPSALQDPLNKAMAGIVNVLLWSSSAWYAKTGVKDNAVAVGLSAALQAFSVLKQIL